MKKLIVTLGIFTLSGCVNPYNYREDQEVISTYTTEKPVQETQECILTAWQKNPLLYQINAQKTGKYYSVVASADNADVFADGDLTRINFYSLRGALDVTNGKEKRIAGIKSCL